MTDQDEPIRPEVLGSGQAFISPASSAVSSPRSSPGQEALRTASTRRRLRRFDAESEADQHLGTEGRTKKQGLQWALDRLFRREGASKESYKNARIPFEDDLSPRSPKVNVIGSDAWRRKSVND